MIWADGNKIVKNNGDNNITYKTGKKLFIL